jgi:ATP-binding cassette subfamily C protein CydC
MSSLHRLLRLITPYGWWVLSGVLLSFATIGSSIGLITVSAYLISKAAVTTDLAELTLAITGVRLFAISRAAFRYLERVTTHTATFRILTHLRVWFYRSIEPLAPARLLAYRSGDLLARIVSDIETLENFYVRAIIPPLAAALVTGLAFVLLGSFDFQLGLALLVFLVLTGVALPFYTRQLSRIPSQELVQARAELTAGLVDQIQGLADLLAFGQENQQKVQMKRLNQASERAQERLARIRGMGDGLAALFTGLCGLTVLCLAIPLVSNGQIDGVYLALLPLAAIASFEAAQPLSNALGQTQASQEAAKRLFELIDAEPPVRDPVHPAPFPIESNLIVKELSFRYDPEESQVLQRLSFQLPAGGRLAIVGPSGAGKSTLVNLLLRFWDYSEGSLQVGGYELHDLSADDARDVFSVVSLQTYLFNVTIQDNLLLANPNASDEQIIAACRTAQVHDFILTLPQGYDTLIGENGYLLSAGQRQRLAIARALLKPAPILLLDEPTANLDPLTERNLLQSILNGSHERSVMLITHRLAGLSNFNEILVLKAGQIVQRGTHGSLSKEAGLYRQMWQVQNQVLLESGNLDVDTELVE